MAWNRIKPKGILFFPCSDGLESDKANRNFILSGFVLEFKVSLLKQTSLFEFKRRQHCQSRTSWDGLESDKAERNFILSLVGWPGIG